MAGICQGFLFMAGSLGVLGGHWEERDDMGVGTTYHGYPVYRRRVMDEALLSILSPVLITIRAVQIPAVSNLSRSHPPCVAAARMATTTCMGPDRALSVGGFVAREENSWSAARSPLFQRTLRVVPSRASPRASSNPLEHLYHSDDYDPTVLGAYSGPG